MDDQNKNPSAFASTGLSFDFLNEIGIDKIDFEKEARYVGALTGSVVGSFVSSQLSWSLVARVISVIGGSYSGALLAGLAYKILEELAEEE